MGCGGIGEMGICTDRMRTQSDIFLSSFQLVNTNSTLIVLRCHSRFCFRSVLVHFKRVSNISFGISLAYRKSSVCHLHPLRVLLRMGFHYALGNKPRVLLPPAFRRMREGNVFTGVCPSTGWVGGGSWYPCSLVPGLFWGVPPGLWSQILSQGVTPVRS